MLEDSGIFFFLHWETQVQEEMTCVPTRTVPESWRCNPCPPLSIEVDQYQAIHPTKLWVTT